MGKAVIMSCDQGRASIQYDLASEFLVKQIAKFDEDLATLGARILNIETQISDQEAELLAAAVQVDTKIADYTTCTTSTAGWTTSECTAIHDQIAALQSDLSWCVIDHSPPVMPFGQGAQDPACVAISDNIKRMEQEYQVCVGTYGAGSPEHPQCKAINAWLVDAQKQMAGPSARLYAMKQERDDLKVQKAQIEALRIVYQAELNQDLALRDVWVADWTEDTENPAPASTSGTIEVWGMRYASDTCRVPRKKVILEPQYDTTRRRWKWSEDFQVTGPMDSEPCRVFDMLATWCWVQEHRPRYITARITALSQSSQLATVVRSVPTGLDAITGVDYGWTAENVPFTYRDCGSRAFKVGDRVVVEFSGPNKANPRIIGFEDHPRPCNQNPPIVLWDSTAHNYIKLEYLQDLGGGNPGWQRTDHGAIPICGSFQWRRMSDGVFISVAASTISGQAIGYGGSIWKDEAFLSYSPTGKTCTGAALRSSGHLVAFCIDTNEVSLYVKPSGGSWALLAAVSGGNIHPINYQGALFNQDVSECYAFWADDAQPTIGAWKFTITWGMTISVALAAVADSNTTAITSDSGTWADGYNGSAGYKTQNKTSKTAMPRLMMAYSPDDGSVQSIRLDADEFSSGATDGTWTDPPPGTYRFEQAGSATTSGNSRLSGSGGFSAAFAYGGNTASEKVFDNTGTPVDTIEISGFTASSGPMADAINSLGIPGPFPGYNARIVSPLHFGGLMLVQAYQTDGSDTAQGYAVLLRADGSLLASYPQSSALYSPELPPRLTINNQPPQQWNTQNTAITARIPYAQEVFKTVAQTPSGRAIGISGNHTSGVFVIDDGDVAALVPEWSAGHTILMIGFSKGWKGKGIPWP